LVDQTEEALFDCLTNFTFLTPKFVVQIEMLIQEGIPKCLSDSIDVQKYCEFRIS